MVNRFFVGIITMSIIIMAESQFSEYRKCGKPSPVEEKDCTKYGTDSDFLCCYVKQPNGSNAVCALISYARANQIGIKGKYTAPDETYYSCGNVSVFLKFTFVVLGLLAFVF